VPPSRPVQVNQASDPVAVRAARRASVAAIKIPPGGVLAVLAPVFPAISAKFMMRARSRDCRSKARPQTQRHGITAWPARPANYRAITLEAAPASHTPPVTALPSVLQNENHLYQKHERLLQCTPPQRLVGSRFHLIPHACAHQRKETRSVSNPR
jgi:hypothetical protein